MIFCKENSWLRQEGLFIDHTEQKKKVLYLCIQSTFCFFEDPNDSLLQALLLHFSKIAKGKTSCMHLWLCHSSHYCIRVFVNNSNALSMKMRRERKTVFKGRVSYDELKKNWMIFVHMRNRSISSPELAFKNDFHTGNSNAKNM